MKKLERNEALLLFGHWTSKIGDKVFDYVNSVVIVAAFTDSAWVLALYQSSQTLINILFNLVGGAVADAGKRRRVLIVTDLLSALVCFAAGFFIRSAHMAAALITANALLALIFSFSSPTFKSIVREMIRKERISFYNSIANAGSELIGMAGPVAGLVLMGLVGAQGALWINAATFAVSALSEALLVPLAQGEAGRPKRKTNVLAEIGEGIRYLWRDKTTFSLLVLSALVNFFLAGYNLLLPYTDVLYRGTFTGFYSKVMVLEAAGGIAGSFLNSKLPERITNRYHTLILFLGASGAALVLPPLVSPSKNLPLCLLPFFLFGAALTMFNINFMSYVQIHVEEAYLGRVFSVIFTIAVLFMPAGSFVFSLAGTVNSIAGFLLPGTGIIALAAFFLVFVRPGPEERG